MSANALTSQRCFLLHALRTFAERWHRVLQEALRIRRADTARPDFRSAWSEMLVDLGLRRGGIGSLYRTPIARRADVLAFADMAIADAAWRFGTAATKSASARRR